jgi:hypothetical protein
MDSVGSIEVTNVIISIGTKKFWKSASVPELVADQRNGHLTVDRTL